MTPKEKTLHLLTNILITDKEFTEKITELISSLSISEVREIFYDVIDFRKSREKFYESSDIISYELRKWMHTLTRIEIFYNIVNRYLDKVEEDIKKADMVDQSSNFNLVTTYSAQDSLYYTKVKHKSFGGGEWITLAIVSTYEEAQEIHNLLLNWICTFPNMEAIKDEATQKIYRRED